MGQTKIASNILYESANKELEHLTWDKETWASILEPDPDMSLLAHGPTTYKERHWGHMH